MNALPKQGVSEVWRRPEKLTPKDKALLVAKMAERLQKLNEAVAALQRGDEVDDALERLHGRQG